MIQVTVATPIHDQTIAMNEALMIGSIRQHELTAEAEKAYKALAESEERFSVLYDALPVAVFVCNLDAVIQNYNHRAVELWGREPICGVDRYCGSLNIFLTDGTPLAHADSPIVNVLRTGVSARNVEVLIERPDGSRLPVSVNFVALHGVDGKVSGSVVSFDDISERLRVEGQVQQSAERFRFLAESMPQKIFTADSSGAAVYLNQQWMDYTGLTIDRMQGWGWGIFIHPDDLSENHRVWRHSIDTGEPFQFVHRFQRSDGEMRWHLSRAHAMRDDAGKISMWIGSSTDIQEQKENEEKLQWANDDLKQFAFAASHDLLEPLRTLTSYSQLLVKGFQGQLDDEALACVDFITKSAKEMRTLLSDLLSYTEAGADRGTEAEPVKLNWVMESVKYNLNEAIAASGTKLTWGDLPTLLGHETRYVQLFQNLVSNAVKYRRDVAPEVHVSAVLQTDEWLFSVADNGIGIEPQYFEKIFGVFKRLHGKSIPGTGIGLAICQRVVSRYGGRIWVESGMGQGTTFHFTLPAMKEVTDGK